MHEVADSGNVATENNEKLPNILLQLYILLMYIYVKLKLISSPRLNLSLRLRAFIKRAFICLLPTKNSVNNVKNPMRSSSY